MLNDVAFILDAPALDDFILDPKIRDERPPGWKGLPCYANSEAHSADQGPTLPSKSYVISLSLAEKLTLNNLGTSSSSSSSSPEADAWSESS